MPDIAASLSVNRQHLLQALKQIKKLTGIGRQPAVLTYTNLQLLEGDGLSLHQSQR